MWKCLQNMNILAWDRQLFSSLPPSTQWARMLKFSEDGLSRNLTQNIQNVLVYQLYFCHTLATSVTSRKTRCWQLGLICPVCTLYTQLRNTKCRNIKDQGESCLTMNPPAELSACPPPLHQCTNTMPTAQRGGLAIPPN